jgi:hypothetical protein
VSGFLLRCPFCQADRATESCGFPRALDGCPWPGARLDNVEGFDLLWSKACQAGSVDISTRQDGSVLATVYVYRESKLAGAIHGHAMSPRTALAIALAQLEQPDPEIHRTHERVPPHAMLGGYGQKP